MKLNGDERKRLVCETCEYAPLCESEGFAPGEFIGGGLIVCLVVKENRKTASVLVPEAMQIASNGNILSTSIKVRRFPKGFFKKLLWRWLG
jgi:hypothetical protein